MIFAIFADVHAHAPALLNVLNDARDCGAGRFICLGDVIGYGPDAAETIALVRQHVDVCLRGNHDAAVAGTYPLENFNKQAREMALCTRAQLSAGELAFLRDLPLGCVEGGFAAVHAEFSRPDQFGYVEKSDDAEASFAIRAEQLLFVGHTHVPAVFVKGEGAVHLLGPTDFVLEAGKRYLVNPGAVGLPRAYPHRTTYCLYDSERKTVTFRSLPFDTSAYARRLAVRHMTLQSWLLPLKLRRLREIPFRRAPARHSARITIAACCVVLMVLAFGIWSMSRTAATATAPAAPLVPVAPVVPAAPTKLTAPAVSSTPATPSTMVPSDTSTIVAPHILARLTIPSGTPKTYVQTKLKKGASPAQLVLVFKDATGRTLATECATVKTRKSMTVKVPPESISAELRASSPSESFAVSRLSTTRLTTR